VSPSAVDILRAAVDAFNRRDEEAVLGLIDPEVEYESEMLEKKTYRGHAGLREYRADLDEAWIDWQLADNEFLDADGDRVLHLYRIMGRGITSGILLDQEVAALWTLRDGKIVHGKAFRDRGEARRAAGLAD
jgi:ketosteroid isomerase-like protein